MNFPSFNDFKNSIFEIKDSGRFNELALRAYEIQRERCCVYREYLELIGKGDFHPASVEEIPFLPIRLFKSKSILTDPQPDCGTGKKRIETAFKKIKDDDIGESGSFPVSGMVFKSSGTTGMTSSIHLVPDVTVYERSFREAFRMFYGESGTYNLLALLPSYLERKDSSLVYMADKLISDTKDNGAEGGFFLYNHDELFSTLKHLHQTSSVSERLQQTSSEKEHFHQTSSENERLQQTLSEKEYFQQTSSENEYPQQTVSSKGPIQSTSDNTRKTILLGVSFALLDFAAYVTEQIPDSEERRTLFSNVVIMETGGMKGRGEELSRQELHRRLSQGFCTKDIHSEYGMCELFSQAYSFSGCTPSGKDTPHKEISVKPASHCLKEGLFFTPPWMKVFARDLQDPFRILKESERQFAFGGLNIIDLANIDTCCFIETEDMGSVYPAVSKDNIAEDCHLKSIHPPFTVDGRIKDAELRGCNMLLG